ncbi:MAG TPA: hypothetical protein DEA40_09955, partial [Parvularcula sp.]|nr:hypothetical protein [Parvularcula sp.]
MINHDKDQFRAKVAWLPASGRPAPQAFIDAAGAARYRLTEPGETPDIAIVDLYGADPQSEGATDAVAAARRAGWNVREKGLQGGTAPLVFYASDEAHSCIRKAIELLGIGTDNLRLIPTGANCRMSVAALAEAVAADRAAGRVPACVIGNAGTVNTGAIDPLDALADLAA